jgi:hypothetical protein
LETALLSPIHAADEQEKSVVSSSEAVRAFERLLL